MKQEDKDLLLKDLTARLPYGVKCRWESDGFSNEGELTDICHQESVNGFKYWDGYFNNDGEDIPIEIIKPYLRPMSSMTDDERKYVYRNFSPTGQELFSLPYVDWLNEHHFDYRRLIEKGLALEAPEDMYNFE